MAENGLRRRELLLAGAAAGTAVLLHSAPTRALAAPNALYGGLRPELTSVTEQGFSAWWVTDGAGDTTVRVRAAGERWRELRLAEREQVHVAAVDGLRPGTRYAYELRTRGRAVESSLSNPGTFRTLAPPAGRPLLTLAVLNDIHVGERCSGTISGDFPPCFQAPGYAIRMTSAAVRLARRLKPDFLLVNGDLTDRGRPDEIRRALAVIRKARIPFGVTRGNHDRLLEGSGEDGDQLRRQAFPDRPEGAHALSWSKDLTPALALIALDSCDPVTGDGRLDLGAQLAFLERELARTRREGRRAIVAFHHPIALASTATAVPPVVFGVDPAKGGRDALAIIAAFDHVALVLHGHTHRNYVAYDERSGTRIPFVELGATKEYPGGLSLLRFHRDGVVRTFHRMDEPFCREWVTTSARQVFGRQPEYTRGPLSARAFVRPYDPRLAQPEPSLPTPVDVPLPLSLGTFVGS